MPSKTKVYFDLLKDGQLIDSSKDNLSAEKLHIYLQDKPGYKRISNNLVELEINGILKTVGVFPLVPDGVDPNKVTGKDKDDIKRKVEKAKCKKRVQLRPNALDRVPDIILVIYEFDDVVYFISSDKPEATIDPGNSQTTLFHLDIRHVKRAISNEKVICENVKSRNNKNNRNATITISKSYTALFSDEVQGVLENESTYSFVTKKDFDAIEVVDGFEINEINDPINLKAIGDAAEEFINLAFIENNEIAKKIFSKIGRIPPEIIWMNKNGEAYNSFDFKSKDNIYLEVKGSTSSGSFIWSAGEKNLADKNKENYFLIKVDGIRPDDNSNAQSYSVTVYNYDELSKLETTVMSYKVNE